ncbi:Inosine-5'-monophosphate dehydrogenase [hydrothermal vent metagenome]|uniref:Inosine-5'-monophosphate dehydrogenase n=1 Tax=hydrothermal vent metagenome TaxID=652676 RepID=A0A3B0UH06_9ZZZZ
MKVSTILATKGNKLITIASEQSVREAVSLFVQHNIGALVVLNREGAIEGIISERDVVRQLGDNDDTLSLAVDRLMTSPVITCLPQDDVMSVASVMTERRFRHLPVVEDGALLGIISIGDVLKAQRDSYRGQIDTLETQILATED